MTKAYARTTLLRRLKQQKEDDRRRRSQAIWRKLRRLKAFRQAKTVCCYVALPYEVQTWRMIEAMLANGKRVAVPVMRPRTKRLWLSEVRNPTTELARGAFGVWEPRRAVYRPVRLRDVDLVVVPGVGFDRRGHRLGHGHGYFDRFLARVPRTTPTVGLAFRFQLIDRLPAHAHDRAVKTILSA
ncbi:MAG: 5-formyltetrahydrofolate cyclo-ligase [Candidatus Omnitrophica bacterium CG11_big_fil_rev_8_21_14_0_20_63_9]|nr:MAG: 5-formyltetrahydrofolate cyclo-ligase [Candidatus Omnitrophica bacterium CG11_big_fil_rev_8_21_14_0_20_63_9]